MVCMTENDLPAASGRSRDDYPLPAENAADLPPAPGTDDTAIAPATEKAPTPFHEDKPAKPVKPAKQGTAASSTWVALIVGALLLILLLVFIMQNQQSVQLNLFAWTWNFPLGVGLLLASIIGGLIMACAGIWKMFEMKRNHKRG